MDIDSFEHEASLTPSEMQKRLEKSRDILYKSGAHYVIDNFDELLDVCADINKRLARGEKPWCQRTNAYLHDFISALSWKCNNWNKKDKTE